VHFPSHPVWFWLILGAPFLLWLALWVAANAFKVSLKPLTRWLWVGLILFGVPHFLFSFDLVGVHNPWRPVSDMGFWTCGCALLWIKSRQTFETLGAPRARWYLPWTAAAFSIPTNMRILVRNIDSVSPWYIEKLGLSKLAGSPRGESGSETFKFKEDGNSVTLTTRGGFATGKTPILFTKKIVKIKNVLVARGVDTGAIERDRQGINYFQIHDPEGNVIEVVEER
jgi:predicted enzyme related to lactoylglutathione lyase